MIANRPDWCISRQRNWGVPLPFFLHKDTGELHPDTMALIDRAATIVEKGGIEAWSRAHAPKTCSAPEGPHSAEHYAKQPAKGKVSQWHCKGQPDCHAWASSNRRTNWGPEWIKLKAEAGGGGFVLNGMKRFVPFAHVADHDHCAGAHIRTNPMALRSLRSIRSRKGVEMSPMTHMDLTSKGSEVRLKNVMVPEENIVGEVDGAWPVLKDVLARLRSAQAQKCWLGAQVDGDVGRIRQGARGVWPANRHIPGDQAQVRRYAA